MDISSVLQENGFTEKESKIYLSALELGSAPASSIARHCGENRITVYTILKDFVARGLSNEISKGGVGYYAVLNPKQFVKLQKEKVEKLENLLPELLAINNNYTNKPRIFFYDGLEGLKNVYTQVILSSEEMDVDESFLTFVGTQEIDKQFLKYLTTEFIPRRMNYATKTKSILAKGGDDGYLSYHNKNHDFLLIDDSLFDMGNEIIIFGKNKVAICMYGTKEMSALVVESKTLHDGLKSMFNLIWRVYKNKK